MSEGEPLTGDGVTQGIVRIGDTVRRPLRPFSLTVQAYLAHLRDAGFTGAPLPLGVDEQGREVLSFVPGDVPRNPLPPETAGDDVLVALARLIRALHEASAGWVPPPGAVWGGTPASPSRPASARAELVSHCDYYPGNVVFRAGRPAALIDFDLAHPTTRLYDIANALWYWGPLRNGDPRDRAPAFADADMVHRVAVFADAYGMTAEQRAEFGPFVVDLARRYHEDSRDSAALDPVYRKLWEDGAKDVLPRAEAWLRENAPAITARLCQPDQALSPRDHGVTTAFPAARAGSRRPRAEIRRSVPRWNAIGSYPVTVPIPRRFCAVRRRVMSRACMSPSWTPPARPTTRWPPSTLTCPRTRRMTGRPSAACSRPSPS